MIFRDNLFVPNKYDYVRCLSRPEVPCILCAVAQGDERVANLVVHHGEHHLVSLNMYPYNPGHVMIFPKRHVLDVRELTPEEEPEFHSLMKLSMDIVGELYQATGFNVGFNQGEFSGASIQHLHKHVVPRYRSEIGFLDVIAGGRVIVEDPVKTRERLSEAFAKRFR